MRLNLAAKDGILDLNAFQNPNLFGSPWLQGLDILDFGFQVTHAIATLTNQNIQAANFNLLLIDMKLGLCFKEQLTIVHSDCVGNIEL